VVRTEGAPDKIEGGKLFGAFARLANWSEEFRGTYAKATGVAVRSDQPLSEMVLCCGAQERLWSVMPARPDTCFSACGNV